MKTTNFTFNKIMFEIYDLFGFLKNICTAFFRIKKNKIIPIPPDFDLNFRSVKIEIRI